MDDCGPRQQTAAAASVPLHEEDGEVADRGAEHGVVGRDLEGVVTAPGERRVGQYMIGIGVLRTTAWPAAVIGWS